MKELTIGPIDSRMQLPEIPRPRDIKSGPTFGDTLQDAIQATNDLQKQSDHEIQKLMTGQSEDLHTALIAVQRADLSFQMMMQVRNKLVQAYHEIMRMQV